MKYTNEALLKLNEDNIVDALKIVMKNFERLGGFD